MSQALTMSQAREGLHKHSCSIVEPEQELTSHPAPGSLALLLFLLLLLLLLPTCALLSPPLSDAGQN